MPGCFDYVCKNSPFPNSLGQNSKPSLTISFFPLRRPCRHLLTPSGFQRLPLEDVFICFFLCMDVLSACRYVYHLCTWCPWRPKECVRSLGTEVAHTPAGCWESSPASTLNPRAFALAPLISTYERVDLACRLTDVRTRIRGCVDEDRGKPHMDSLF